LEESVDSFTSLPPLSAWLLDILFRRSFIARLVQIMVNLIFKKKSQKVYHRIKWAVMRKKIQKSIPQNKIGCYEKKKSKIFFQNLKWKCNGMKQLCDMKIKFDTKCGFVAYLRSKFNIFYDMLLNHLYQYSRS
jgi:hypothetical protein